MQLTLRLVSEWSEGYNIIATYIHVATQTPTRVQVRIYSLHVHDNCMTTL